MDAVLLEHKLKWGRAKNVASFSVFESLSIDLRVNPALSNTHVLALLSLRGHS